MASPVVESVAPQPFLRWAGGKRALLPALRAAMPAAFGRYFEPFLGGGALFFALGGAVAARRCVLNDANTQLVTTYRVVRDRLGELVAALGALAVDLDEAEYQAVRASRPSDDVGVAVRFVYLNRTCFNGLWRENRAGEFNVPYGRLRRPRLPDVTVLAAASRRLQGATIRNLDFEDAVERAERGLRAACAGDFVYLDPPYVPASPTASFSAYQAAGFGEREQEHLAGLVRRLSRRGVYVMLSNSDAALTHDIYGPAFQPARAGSPAPGALWRVRVRRTIAASSRARSAVTEILAVNYPAAEMVDPHAFAALALTPLPASASPAPTAIAAQSH